MINGLRRASAFRPARRFIDGNARTPANSIVIGRRRTKSRVIHMKSSATASAPSVTRSIRSRRMATMRSGNRKEKSIASGESNRKRAPSAYEVSQSSRNCNTQRGDWSWQSQGSPRSPQHRQVDSNKQLKRVEACHEDASRSDRLRGDLSKGQSRQR